MANDNNIQPVADDSQIVLYQPNESVKLEVKLDATHETVWLTQQQIADLFGTKRPAITKHLGNIFKSGELNQNSVSSILEHTASDGKVYKTQFYNLDAIISVGYRVNSINATAFRKWATGVLKDYLLKGYSVNQQLLAMQRQLDTRLDAHSQRMTRIEDTQVKQQQQLDFFIRTSIPPAEMVFFEGDFYTARVVPDNHIDIRKWRNESHDRWLIIDDSLYHCGHSLNANGGHKISAITLMGTSPEVIRRCSQSPPSRQT